jgi:hypothetical protein
MDDYCVELGDAPVQKNRNPEKPEMNENGSGNSSWWREDEICTSKKIENRKVGKKLVENFCC